MANAQTLSLKQVQALAGVSHMAVYHWRTGSSTRDPLPTVTGANARAVRVMPRDLKSWAKKHGVSLSADPVAVAAGTVKLKLPATAAKEATKKAAKATKPVKKATKTANAGKSQATKPAKKVSH